MPAHTTLTARLRAAFLGSSDCTGPCLRPVPGTMQRPEGTRRYLIAAPAGDAAEKRGLVLVLHGGGASAEQVMGLAFPPSPLSHWLEIAARERLVVIAPDAGKGGWSHCFASPARVAAKDDVAFIDALIDHAVAAHGVDPARVYLIGVSRGGQMAYRAAIEMPHRLAAFSAVLAGMPPPGQAPQPAAALPVLVVGSTADPLQPYRGGKRWYTLGLSEPIADTADTVRTWRMLAGLPDTPAVAPIPKRDPRDPTKATVSTWGEDDAGLQVRLIAVEHAGHAEPSRLKRYPRLFDRFPGRQNGDFEVAEAAWEFFRHKRRIAPVRD
jgi:polyhydroxybutyrate depolymerase